MQWWYDFFIIPLSKNLKGTDIDIIGELELVKAIMLRDSIGFHSELQEYHSWMYDNKSKKSTPNDRLLMPSEERPEVIDHAMKSVNNYLMFLQSRGYNG